MVKAIKQRFFYLLVLVDFFLIVGLVLLILFLRFLKSVAKTLFYGLTLALVLISIFLIFLVGDIVSFSKNMQDKEVIYLLSQDGNLKTGFLFENHQIIATFEENLSQFDNHFHSEEYDQILDGSYKLFIFDVDKLNYDDNESQKILEYLKGDSTDEAAIASSFLYIIVDNQENDPFFLIKEYRNGNLIVYPKSLLFKVLKR